MSRFGDALQHAFNVFTNQDAERRRNSPWPLNPQPSPFTDYLGPSYAYAPDRVRLRIPNERSIISSIYTRLSIDVAKPDIRHVQLDDEKRYKEDRDSGLNNCLTVEANLDQGARAFRQDIALTLFDYGCAAIVPVDTDLSPLDTGGYDIQTLRVANIVQWFPRHVRVNLYNVDTATRQEITLPKSMVAIVENPLYSIMNEPNSTLQRLLRKLSLLDVVDDKVAGGKLDLLLQLPYVVKSETKRQQAMQRRQDIEFQLAGSKYGIAYIDGTEKVTQLNRPAENNLMSQIEYLVALLYSQLGLTDEIMKGTADEKTMLNYQNRTVEPIVTAIVEAMARSFLTKTARTQGQSIMFFLDPFRLVPLGDIAEIADKFTRNEIATANEIRQIVGLKPHSDPNADKLQNSNMPSDLRGAVPRGATLDTPGVADLLARTRDQVPVTQDSGRNGQNGRNG
jgi:hypothetical protein